MQDAHFKGMFVVLISLLVLTGFLFLNPDVVHPTAAPHPEFPSMLQSTGPFDALSSWLGVIWGLLLIAVIAISSSIGLYRAGTRSWLNTWMTRGMVIYAAVWVLIKVVDGIYLESESPAYFGGFPLPTALLIYGIGIFPIVMIPFYYRYFESDIFSKNDEEQFNALRRRTDEEMGGQQ